MMLAEREYVQTKLLSELCLLEQFVHSLLGSRARGQVGKRGKSKLHTGSLADSCAYNYLLGPPPTTTCLDHLCLHHSRAYSSAARGSNSKATKPSSPTTDAS